MNRIAKIRVLQFIAPAGFYGAENWIMALAKHLDPRRVDCRLAVTHESASQNMELYKRFCALGLTGYRIPMRGRFDVRAILLLSDLIKRQRIDVVHTHGYKSDILGLVAARMAGAAIVATPHGFENAPDIKLHFFISLGCFALKMVDRVAPLSEDLHKDLRKFGIPDRKIKMILNGVDLSEIEQVRGSGLKEMRKPRQEKWIGYVGQLAFRKNIGQMIMAFDLLCREMDNVRLILIGDGPQKQELQSLAESLPCSGKIDFLGYRSDRLELMRYLELFTMTSSLEGIPRCMMEAMALGLPVAAFDIPGVDRLILHGKTGLLSQYSNVWQLAGAWKTILENRALATELATNGRGHILKYFSAQRMAEDYVSLYREQLN